MSVVEEHLLLGDGTQRLHGRCFVGGPDGRAITDNTDADQNADDGDNDHQLDQREAALVVSFGSIQAFHRVSLGELHEVVSFWFRICDSFARLRRLVYYRSVIACKMQVIHA